MEMACYAIVMLIASVIINAALTPKPAEVQPATFSDFDMPQVDEGTAQLVFFGETWTSDWQVLAYGNFRTSKVSAKQGKK